MIFDEAIRKIKLKVTIIYYVSLINQIYLLAFVLIHLSKDIDPTEHNIPGKIVEKYLQTKLLKENQCKNLNYL